MPYNFSEEEQKILAFWQEKNIFEKSLEATKRKKPFVFYDGPPFATGLPHYGHLLQSAVKDAIPRYKTMRGFYVARQWGWDCHGLPIENIVEKELGTKSKKDILAMGVKKFNDLCRERIFTFIHEWERIIPRFGRWADMAHPYRTMDFEYMQSEWWAFKKLYESGLIYEDYRSMHICPRCETTLSQGEVADGYKNIKDLSVTVKFKVKNPEKLGLQGNVYLLAWTTTPWTLPGNVALAIGKDIEYVMWGGSGGSGGAERYIASRHWFAENQIQAVALPVDAGLLMGLEYEPLFDFYASNEKLKNRERGWKVYAADFITADEGTGIAHEAPTFGADDWALLKKENLPFVQHVKMDGTFTVETGEFSGMDLKPRAKGKPEEIREADLAIVRALEGRGMVFGYAKYEHSYPHCWRCDTALLNYATGSWFVAVEKIKGKLLKTAKKITWSPAHIKEGRFGQWLEGARDWSISRQRFWANTIPVWRCGQCNKEMVFASAAELQKASGTRVADLHKEIVDEVSFPCACGGQMQRVPDVLDTWFDSGSVPFASLHYPLENGREIKRRLPADFVGEAQDQTRSWFYYQHVLAGALFSKEAFRNCVVTGIVLAEDGKKMSKKLKNYPDPMEVMEKYGADAMRLYLLTAPVVQAENLSFSEKGVDEIARKNIARLHNVLAFYRLYRDGTAAGDTSKNMLDRWVLGRLGELSVLSTEGYEHYRLDMATRPLIDFIDDLSVWYVRRSRDRFRETDDALSLLKADKQAALATLRYVLLHLAVIMAPAMPFFAEYLYQAVRGGHESESVHLAGWPNLAKKATSESRILAQMAEARQLVTLALAERQAKGIKVRQPLAQLKIKDAKFKNLEREFVDLVKDEVNVKEVVFDATMKAEVELDTRITAELKEEGLAREAVRFVQDMRKEAGLMAGDAIELSFSGTGDMADMIRARQESILKEVGAVRMVPSLAPDNGFFTKEMAVDGQKIFWGIKKTYG